VVLAGEARLAFHGVDRIMPGTATLVPEGGLPEGGRINLTLRRVTVPADDIRSSERALLKGSRVRTDD
jgi:alkylated DNA repair protein (DNA oxidative demethylase)